MARSLASELIEERRMNWAQQAPAIDVLRDLTEAARGFEGLFDDDVRLDGWPVGVGRVGRNGLRRQIAIADGVLAAARLTPPGAQQGDERLREAVKKALDEWNVRASGAQGWPAIAELERVYYGGQGTLAATTPSANPSGSAVGPTNSGAVRGPSTEPR